MSNACPACVEEPLHCEECGAVATDVVCDACTDAAEAQLVYPADVEPSGCHCGTECVK